MDGCSDRTNVLNYVPQCSNSTSQRHGLWASMLAMKDVDPEPSASQAATSYGGTIMTLSVYGVDSM